MADGVFVIIVVRDPRSVLRSWITLGEFPSVAGKLSHVRKETQDQAAHRYCNGYLKDIAFLRSELGSQLSKSYYLLRYEDLIHFPEYHVHSIFDAIDLTPDKNVSREYSWGLWIIKLTSSFIDVIIALL